MAERYRQGRWSCRWQGAGEALRGLGDGPSAPAGTTRRRWTGWRSIAAAGEAFRLVDATNEFIASSEPWALAKRGEDDALGRRAVDRRRGAARRRRAAEPGDARRLRRRSCERVGARVWRPPTCDGDDDLTIRDRRGADAAVARTRSGRASRRRTGRTDFVVIHQGVTRDRSAEVRNPPPRPPPRPRPVRRRPPRRLRPHPAASPRGRGAGDRQPHLDRRLHEDRPARRARC